MASDARGYYVEAKIDEIEKYLNSIHQYELLSQFKNLVEVNKDNLDTLSDTIQKFKQNNNIPEMITQKNPGFFKKYLGFGSGRKSRKYKKQRKSKKSRKSKKQRKTRRR